LAANPHRLRASRAQAVAPAPRADTFGAMMEPTILHCAGACLDASHDSGIIFLDHQGARVRFLDGVDLSTVSAAHLDLEGLHNRFRLSDASRSGSYGRRHPDDTPLFAALAKIVRNTGQVLLVGPGSCKHEFVKFLLRNHPGAFEERVVGVESLDHPTDGQLVAIARGAFAHAAARGQPLAKSVPG
jgi:hypothetical protein